MNSPKALIRLDADDLQMLVDSLTDTLDNGVLDELGELNVIGLKESFEHQIRLLDQLKKLDNEASCTEDSTQSAGQPLHPNSGARLANSSEIE
jgi:hypothetical protein